MRIYRVHFGKKLRAAREKALLTQEDLAEKVGVETSTISKWETGKDFAGEEKLSSIITALGVTADYFEISNEEVKHMGLVDAADFLSRYSKLGPKLRMIVSALVYKDPLHYSEAHLPIDIQRALQRIAKVD